MQLFCADKRDREWGPPFQEYIYIYLVLKIKQSKQMDLIEIKYEIPLEWMGVQVNENNKMS